MTVSFSQYYSIFNGAEKILIIYGEKSRFPTVAAATSLYVWLKKLDKKVTIACAAPALVEFCALVGINKVKTTLPAENLVLTLPYGDCKIDQVISDLNEQTKELSLVIKPQKGKVPLDGSKLKVSYQIPDYDLVVMVDVRSPKELSRLAGAKQHPWTNSERLLTLAHTTNPAPVKAALSDTLIPDLGFCEYLGKLFLDNQVEIDQDVASNLLMGLEKETDNFRAGDEAAIFELAAGLIRRGAVRYRPDQESVRNFMPDNHLPLPRTTTVSTKAAVPVPPVVPVSEDVEDSTLAAEPPSITAKISKSFSK